MPSDLSRNIPSQRDQGDGAPNPDSSQHEVTLHRKRSTPFSVNAEINIVQWMLFFVALATRLWRLDQPRAIVFDELHFGRFAGMYMQRTFFFDSHPPLGKMLLAFGAYMGGFDKGFKFDKIGTEYPLTVPVWGLRFFPALFGSTLIPLVYQIMLEMGLSHWTAALAGVLLVCDNALLVQSRFMLMEGMLLSSCAFTLLTYLKFSEINKRWPFSVSWWVWLCLLGLSSAVTVSIKYAGLLVVCLVLGLIIRDYWRMLPDNALSDSILVKHLCARVGLLVMLPMVTYTGVFYVHLSILTRAGPHDDVMTSAFQSSLEGGLAAITKGQPLYIAYGSQITLRHTYGKPCWLHSHAQVYPVRYPDNRGSSHQQQVTCYTFKDVNNWWIVKDPSRNSLMVDDPIRPVKHGDIVQLVHGMTSRALNSHDVAAPVSPQHQEVTCYIDYNISTPAQNLWKVEILNQESEGDIWKTIKSEVRLLHLNTSQALKTSGRQLPEWGYYQLEVVTDKILQQEGVAWNVEEHRYTRSGDQDEREKEMKNAEMIPLKPTELGFFAKFWELQVKMLTNNQDAQLEHKYSSSPLEWPLMDRNVAYWLASHSNAQIHLLGNVVLWHSAVVAVIGYVTLLIWYLLRRRRLCFDLDEGDWEKFVRVGEVLLAGYLIHYLPYFLLESTLFLYHYLLALTFSILLLAALLEHIYYIIWSNSVQNVYTMLVIVWLTTVINVYLTFSVFTYGATPLASVDIQSLAWLESWDFIVHKAT